MSKIPLLMLSLCILIFLGCKPKTYQPTIVAEIYIEDAERSYFLNKIKRFSKENNFSGSESVNSLPKGSNLLLRKDDEVSILVIDSLINSGVVEIIFYSEMKISKLQFSILKKMLEENEVGSVFSFEIKDTN